MFCRFNGVSNKVKNGQVAYVFHPSFIRSSVEGARLKYRIGMMLVKVRVRAQARVCPVRTYIIPPFPARLSQFSPAMIFGGAENERIVRRFIFGRFFIFFQGRRRTPKR